MADPAAGKDPPHPPAASSAEQMPPPPRPRPSIITQAPSTSNIQLQSTSNLPVEESTRPTNFNPFFILIDDATSKTTAHPRKVHYIFSDDDTSHLLTESLVRSSQQNPDTHSENSAETEPEERVIILDLNKNGDHVEKVTSLSPNWQVLGASVEKAPTLQEGEGERGGGGLMVRVEGVGVGGFEEETEGEEEGEMLGRWDGGMGVLGRVVGLCDAQDREEREREEWAKDKLHDLVEERPHVGSGLEVSRGDLSKGHLSRVEMDKGKGKEKERKDSLPEEDIGEG